MQRKKPLTFCRGRGLMMVWDGTALVPDLRAAAEALFVHRNTVRYRLSKIEELLGLRLHDVQSVELLGVCLRIARLLGQEDEE